MYGILVLLVCLCTGKIVHLLVMIVFSFDHRKHQTSIILVSVLCVFSCVHFLILVHAGAPCLFLPPPPGGGTGGEALETRFNDTCGTGSMPHTISVPLVDQAGCCILGPDHCTYPNLNIVPQQSNAISANPSMTKILYSHHTTTTPSFSFMVTGWIATKTTEAGS